MQAGRYSMNRRVAHAPMLHNGMSSVQSDGPTLVSHLYRSAAASLLQGVSVCCAVLCCLQGARARAVGSSVPPVGAGAAHG